jgi:hypothetical protein
MTEQDLVKIGSTYARHNRISLGTVGVHATDDGAFFPKLINGKTCTIRRANSILKWFSDNWPDNELDWPTDIPRPVKSGGDQEAA